MLVSSGDIGEGLQVSKGCPLLLGEEDIDESSLVVNTVLLILYARCKKHKLYRQQQLGSQCPHE